MRRRLLVVVLVVGVLGACSDGDDGAEDGSRGSAGRSDEEPSSQPSAGGTAREEAVVSLMVEQLAGADDPNGLQFDDEEARCAAQAVVADLGAERLAELGIDPQADEPPQLYETALEPEEIDAVYTAITSCVDMESQFAAMLASGGLPADQARCVAQRYLATDLVKQAIFAGHDPELNAQIDAAIANATESCAS